MVRLSELPYDLKTLILSYLYRPSDLVSLCLVNKDFHEIAVHPLYRTLTLDIGGNKDTRIAALLNPRNIGLHHIHNVELYRAESADVCCQGPQPDLAIAMLLEFLPPNLEKFSWHPWMEFKAQNLVQLYKRQKQMTWLEAIGIDSAFDANLIKELNIESVVQKVSKLGLYPDSKRTLDFGCELMRWVKKLEKLTIHANFENASPPMQARDLNDTSTAPGLVTRSLFAHMLPFDKCTPMILKELTLQKVHLRYAADTYCRVIDFASLEALRILECSGTDALLAELSKSSKLPKKMRTFEVKAEDNQQEGEVLSTLEGFLCLVSGIERLTIDVAFAKEMVSHAAVTRHARTLKSLIVHANEEDAIDSDEEEHTFDSEGIEKLCKQCQSLEQISLSFPESHIIRANSSEYEHYGAMLKTLPKLVTLNITSWPSNVSATSGRLSRKLYEHLLQRVAQDIFEAFAEEAIKEGRRQELSVIAFGTSDKIYEREDSKTTIIFVKGTLLGPVGGATPAAVPIGWRLRKYVEPKSDILDFALSRITKPPVKDSIVDDNVWETV